MEGVGGHGVTGWGHGSACRVLSARDWLLGAALPLFRGRL